jgi:hypothetical protein
MKRSLFVILVIIAVSISAQAKYSDDSGTAGDPFEKDFDIIVKLKGLVA